MLMGIQNYIAHRSVVMKIKISVLYKCILTGIIYAVMTCIVQVPVANILFSVLRIQSDSSISDEMLPILLVSILFVGIAMAFFYYLNGHRFASDSKLKQGVKFGMFVYLSNYIPQVFFLDANKGLADLIHGGFPVIQVELFDFVILMTTVLLMITYMPCRYEVESGEDSMLWPKYFWGGSLFSIILVILQETFLPLLGFESMTFGLNVSSESIPFFYGVMIIGFIMAGFLVSKYTLKAKHKNVNDKFCLQYAILIWCAFDLTMIPLGYGLGATIAFTIVSMVSFIAVEFLCIYFIKSRGY